MVEIIARFADGRLLVREEKAIESHYVSGSIAFRIGLVHTVEKVLSVDANPSGYPQYKFAVPLKEVLVSGDTTILILRRIDLAGLISGEIPASGYATEGVSGVVASGTGYMGKINIVANVIGY